jgi:diguanylate cyclase (GGDEF)-like protein
MVLELSDCDLKALLEFSLTLIKEKAIKHNIRLSFDVSDEIGIIRADERKVKQVVFNILSNAAKFTPDGGAIGIEAKKTNEGEVLVSVWDTGVGIEEKDRHKVFATFEQIESDYSRKYAGTGLGMPLTKELVELHGGRIWFESEGRGRGSRFSFTLPMYSPQQILQLGIEHRIKKAKEENRELALFVINFDNYSELEKTIGEEKAQDVVLNVLQTLKNIARSDDYVTIRKKDEIVVVVEVSKKNISKMNIRLKEAIKSSIFKSKKEGMNIDFSCGFSIYPEDGNSGEDLLEVAIEKLASEKEEGLERA